MNTPKKQSYFVKRKKCPVCNSKIVKEIYSCRYTKNPIKRYLENFYKDRMESQYLLNEFFVLVQCNNCEAIYQKYIPNMFFMKIIYGKWLSTKKEDNIDDRTIKIREHIREISIIKEMIRKKNNLKFLDYGMGTGEWCLAAKSVGIEVFGLDLSKELVDRARIYGIKTLNEKDLKKHSFDYINTEQVFEHISNPLQTLKKLRKSLTPEGIIKISVPNGKNLKEYINKENWGISKGKKGSLNPVSPLEHITSFTYKSLIIMGASASLEEIKIPLIIQYKYTNFFDKPKKILNKLFRPFYLKYGSYSTYIFFQKSIKKKIAKIKR